MNNLLEKIKTPQESVNDDSVLIAKVHVKNGEKVEKDHVLAEIETSKALIDIPCQKSGFVNCFCEENQEVSIGETLFEIYSEKFDRNEIPKIDEGISLETKKEIIQKIQTKFSKGAEKLILKNKIEKNIFNNFDFVTTEIVEKTLNSSEIKLPKKISDEVEPLAIDNDLILNIEKLNKQKLNEIKYLSDVNSSGLVSRLTIFIKSDIDKIIVSQNFISSTPLPLITFEVSRLLIKYPTLNSFFHSSKKITHKNINIGIAFDNGINGLKVASINNADSMDLNSIEESISEISLKYNQNKLSLKEISAASFTITDLFSSGVSNFHPLININNSMILGICGLNNGGFNIEASFDHRVSNGLEVSEFLNDLRYRLEAHYLIDQKIKKSSYNKSCTKCLRSLEDDMTGRIQFVNVVNTKGEDVICSLCLMGY